MIPADFRDRLRQTLDSLSLDVSAAAIEQLEEYFRLLARWNATINLTSLPLDGWNTQTVDRLLIEPILSAKAVPEAVIRWFDLGSGGGSPAIPLKILRPSSSLTMVEAKERKAAFLSEVIRTLGLTDASVETTRVETLQERVDLHEAVELITARALRLDAGFFQTTARLLSGSGDLLLFSSVGTVLELPPTLRLSGTTPLFPGSILFHVKQSG